MYIDTCARCMARKTSPFATRSTAGSAAGSSMARRRGRLRNRHTRIV